jgi:phospholipid/cholesterol/gamma-HCH transport system substrate-binding protein
MSQTKFEWKVGLFVMIGLILLAGLMLNFSKGLPFLKKTYALRLRAENVGGIKPKAGVLMSGVKIGNVVDSILATNGSVIIRLEIYDEFKIDRNATFMLDALGFLGDQYVAVTVTNTSGQYLTNGEIVSAQSPLNLQEAMRSTAGLLNQAQATMRTLDQAISNINKTVLNDATLTSFAGSISNLQTISGNANKTLGKIDSLVETNAPVLGASVSNLFDFSTELKTMLATNQNDVALAVRNFRNATSNLNELVEGVKATNGAAGLLLRDEKMKADLASLATNLNITAGNLSTFSSNLNSRGIWSMMWKPKAPKKSEKNH